MNKELYNFLIEAKKQTYANANVEKVNSSRKGSHDYHYENNGMIYHDTYFGGTKFMGEEEISSEILKLSNGSFGKIANLKASGGDVIYEELLSILKTKNSNASDMMNVAIKIGAEPALYGIVLDAIAHFGLADLYPIATRAITDINRLNLKPDITIFKIITEIKKCL